MTTAAVSVLIPCHDAAPYLAATLESALTQTLAPLEIIVVDDRSTDASRSIAETFAPRVTVVAATGAGASAARNQASALARGEFFQYLDADDLLDAHALQSRVEVLEATHADVAISDWRRLEQRAGRWESSRTESGRLPEGVAADLAILRGFWAPPAAILYRRTVWERGRGWLPTLPIIQDARFLFDAAHSGHRLVHVTGSGAGYRQHGDGSLSSRDPVRFWQDVLTNTREIERLWQSEDRLDTNHLRALADCYSNCALIGLSKDEGLFRAASADLGRFSGRVPSRRTRAALLVNRLVGYSAARFLLSPRGVH